VIPANNFLIAVRVNFKVDVDVTHRLHSMCRCFAVTVLCDRVWSHRGLNGDSAFEESRWVGCEFFVNFG